MRHATVDDLQALAPLLAQLRTLAGLAEKKPGTFYKKSAAFLHFHEDSGVFYADIKQDGAFTRYALDSGAAKATLFKLAQRLSSKP